MRISESILCVVKDHISWFSVSRRVKIAWKNVQKRKKNVSRAKRRGRRLECRVIACDLNTDYCCCCCCYLFRKWTVRRLYWVYWPRPKSAAPEVDSSFANKTVCLLRPTRTALPVPIDCHRVQQRFRLVFTLGVRDRIAVSVFSILLYFFSLLVRENVRR